MSALIVLCFLAGLAAVACGAAMIYLPAGIIAGGLGLILLAAVLSRGAAEEPGKRPEENPQHIRGQAADI